MIKRRGRSQIPMTINSLESRGQMNFDWGVLYTVGKIFLKAIKYFHCIIIKKDLFEKDMNIQSFWITRVLILRLPFGNFREK
jgi:hypothetical protein